MPMCRLFFSLVLCQLCVNNYNVSSTVAVTSTNELVKWPWFESFRILYFYLFYHSSRTLIMSFTYYEFKKTYPNWSNMMTKEIVSHVPCFRLTSVGSFLS